MRNNYASKLFEKLCVLEKICLSIPWPGISNIVYEVLSYEYTVSVLSYRSMYLSAYAGIPRDSFRLGCLLVVFRNILNEYTTGICVTASAFFRYCYVCHPTRNILNEKRLRSISTFIAIFAVTCLVSNMAYFALVFQPRYPSGKQSVLERKLIATDDRFDFFLYQCESYPFRYGNRLLFDATACLGIPGVLSGYFYVNVIYRLATRNRDQSRNRNLSIAFVVGWLLWIITWVPHYYITSMSLAYAKLPNWPVSFEFLRYLQTVAQNIFLLYSHLNPILLLFVLTPFLKLFLKIRAFLFMSHKSGYGISNDENILDVPIEGQNQFKDQKRNILRKLLILISTSLVVTVFTSCFGSFLSEKASLNVSERTLHLKTSTMTDIYRTHIHFIMDIEDLGSEIMTRKSICAEKHGVMNIHYQRCYFVEAYQSRGLNLIEQIDFCKSQSAVLSYPRNKGEVRFLWKVYIEAIGENNFKQMSFQEDWFIHTGFQLKTKSNVAPEFISADDLFIVSGYEDYWLKEYYDYVFSDYALIHFFGPGICITASIFPMRCPTVTLRRHFVCSVDLLMSPNEEIDYKFYFDF